MRFLQIFALICSVLIFLGSLLLANGLAGVGWFLVIIYKCKELGYINWEKS